MRLTIVYDNNADGSLAGGWGFSFFIRSDNSNILFDTGWDGHLLLDNLGKLGISADEIDKVVLSHQHWDHIGGLPCLLNANPSLEVYVPASFSSRLKDEISERAELIEVSNAMEICANVHSTGEIGGNIKEQSLILKSGRGVCLVTGCAHPGLAEIVDATSNFGKLVGVIGGLHSSNEYGLLEGLDLIAACHCTFHKKEISKRFPGSFRDACAGWSVEL